MDDNTSKEIVDQIIELLGNIVLSEQKKKEGKRKKLRRTF